MDITKVFKAEPNSIASLLERSNQGIFIPAYQRAYAWDAKDVGRLLEDAAQGISQLLESQKSLRFLGTIIAVDDRSAVGVPETLEAELPTSVMTIVDGQQRLCTLVILNVIFHEALSALVGRLGEDEASAWLRAEILDYIQVLEGSFRFKAKSGETIWSFYPKVIRSMADRWGRHPEIAVYASPIADFLWSYTRALEHGRGATGTWTASTPTGEGEALRKVIGHVRTTLGRLEAATDPDIEIPDPKLLAANANVQAELWPNRLPAIVVEAVATEEGMGGVMSRILRLFALARYLNTRVAVTLVTTSSEDYAFDVFEALNTTGQPLTAFETFRPLVIQHEGDDYRQSATKTHVDVVQSYLDGFAKAEERQKATTALTTPFALVNDGFRLESHLSAQRRYLRSSFQGLTTQADRRAFTADLALMSRFIGEAWTGGGRTAAPMIPGSPGGDEVASFCFEALRTLRHDIVLAPLMPFLEPVVERPGEPGPREAYFAAMRAVAAFSILWRAAKGGTAGIDGEYRKLMAKGLEGGAPLARRSRTGAADLANLRDSLRARLARSYPDRGRWVRAVEQRPVLQENGIVARFLLMAASHDAVPDVAAPGLVAPGRLDSVPLLRGRAWHDPTLATVEHVAPESQEGGRWDPAIYDDHRTVQQLGNLVLMPKRENQAADSVSWIHKRLLYRMFAATSLEEARHAMDGAQAVGYTVGVTVADLVQSSNVLPLCRAIACRDGDWDTAFIATRSHRLAELAYDRLHGWLEVPPAPTPGAGRRGRRGVPRVQGTPTA